ncbi:flagellar hook-basal body complex protein FliE [Metabacillus lacus]|nr:flagellar hook-basal body complex protein FliE [Metabacillus lacus]
MSPVGKMESLSKVQTNNVSFSELLKQSLNEVNKAQGASDSMTEALASGRKVELHDVMIAAEKASVMMLTTIEIRNKAVEAYQEISRMQM